MNQQVNFTILSGSTQFGPISIVGGYTYVTGYNPKGILIYRASQTQFIAFDRSCTKDGCDVTNAFVTVQTGNTSVKDTTGCKSMFNLMDGTVLQGPATVALYQYHTSWDGNQLHVYN
jgi:Rieske Fe-S protein